MVKSHSSELIELILMAFIELSYKNQFLKKNHIQVQFNNMIKKN